jgi:hypothetical protein
MFQNSPESPLVIVEVPAAWEESAMVTFCNSPDLKNQVSTPAAAVADGDVTTHQRLDPGRRRHVAVRI